MTLYYATYNQKNIREVYRALEEGIFRDATFARDVTVNGDLTVLGDIVFHDASFDTFVIKGRFSTMTAAGAAVEIDATTYQYEQGWEIRYKVTDWADVYTLSNFQAVYFRAESAEANTTANLSGLQAYSVAIDVDQGYVQGIEGYGYLKGSVSATTKRSYGVHGEFTTDAGATKIISEEAAALLGKINLGSTNFTGLTKVHGAILRFGCMDGQSPAYGQGILIEDDADMSGICTLTDGIKITIACADGIEISSACSANAINLSGANATSIAISGANTSTAMLISGTWGSSSNYGAITLAGDVAGTALALGASATSLIGVRIDLTAAVTAGNDFMAIHSELETSGAMVDGFIIGMYQRVRIAHVAYENYAIWGRMDVNVAQTGDTGNQYLGVFGAVNFAAGAHALLATGGGYGVLGTASIATGGTLDQPLIGGYFECNAVANIAGLTTASRHRMLGYCDYGVDVLCQTSNGTAGVRVNTTDSAVLNAGVIFEATTGSITNAFKFNAANTAHAVVAGGAGSATVAAGAWLQIRIDVAGTPYYFPVCSVAWTNV